MDTETIKRLKGWLYLRLPPEDWSMFGDSASSVLRTFDNDSNPDAILRFATGVIFLEAQRLNSPGMFKKRQDELIELGVDPEALKRVARWALEVQMRDD
jgi:hypothetical protein